MLTKNLLKRLFVISAAICILALLLFISVSWPFFPDNLSSSRMDILFSLFAGSFFFSFCAVIIDSEIQSDVLDRILDVECKLNEMDSKKEVLSEISQQELQKKSVIDAPEISENGDGTAPEAALLSRDSVE